MSKSSSPGLTPSGNGRVDFEAIKRTADLVAVIQRHGVELQREGKDWIGLCPFHDDKKPSLRVTPGKGLWRCMSCDAAGNVIQFVAKKQNVSDREVSRVTLFPEDGGVFGQDVSGSVPEIAVRTVVK